MSKGKCVVVAMVSDTWSDSVRRGFYSTADQFILSLLSDTRIDKVVVADHPRGLLSQVRRRLDGDRPAPTTPVLSGTRPVMLRTALPTTAPRVVARYRSYDRQIRFALRRRAIAQADLVTFNLWHAAYGDHDGYGRVLFYAQDDEREIPRLAHLRERSDAAYKAIAERGIPICAVSKQLLSRISPTGEGRVVPNGIDPVLWSRPLGQHSATPSRRSAAYVGTIDDRIDVNAVRSLAEAGFEVRLAGPNRSTSAVDALNAIPGVTVSHPIQREHVPGFVGSADICFLAHHRTGLTEAMSPLKVYEYLCTGKPVVTTSLPGITDDPDVRDAVHLVRDSDSFGEVAAEALAAPKVSEARRTELVGKFSWRARHADLITLLAEG